MSSPALAEPLIEGLLLGLDVPPALTVSKWAERHFVFPSESAEAGRWSPRRAAYQVGMLDAYNEADVREIVFKTSAQVGKTTIFLIIVGYIAHRYPAPMLFIEPTIDMVEAFSREKLEPAIRDCPTLNEVFPPAKSRSGENKVRHKRFSGGFIALVGANSPTGLRMRSIKYVIADEVDAYETSAGKEGDPLELARKRTQTFWDSKFLQSSTPANKATSKISRAFSESDQRYFMVPCPECGQHQRLQWKTDRNGGAPTNIIWDKGRPETARYVCEHNGCILEDADLKAAVRDGHWKAHAPHNGIAGFHISELYSPFSSLSEIVAAFEKALGFTDRMQVFWNTVLGEEWEGEIEGTVTAKELFVRREKFDRLIVPARAGLLTAGVDTQHDRLELMIMAWGMDNERWMLDHVRLMGDPNGPAVWASLTENLLRVYPHELGHRSLMIEVAAIDSGGWHTQKVYDFCTANILAGRLWWPIKGVSGSGKPIWKRSGIALKTGVSLYLVGVDDAKSSCSGALRIVEPGPNCVHIPTHIDMEALERLTVEKVKLDIDDQGFPTREWIKPEGARNEEWDCFVYNYAARMSVTVDMAGRLVALSNPPEQAIDAAEIARRLKR